MSLQVPSLNERVLVVEDDEACRKLLVAIVQTGGLSAIEAATGEEALSLADDPTICAAILDVRLPGISGYEVCQALRARRGSQLPIVFVSGDRTESYDRTVGLLLGADDYIVKPFAPDELLVRVRRLIRKSQPELAQTELTPRELEILRLLAAGDNQHTIASKLVISPKTVRTHIERILAKLRVHSRAEAVAVAYRLRLVAS